MSKSVLIVCDSAGLRRVVSSEDTSSLPFLQLPFAQVKRVMP